MEVGDGLLRRMDGPDETLTRRPAGPSRQRTLGAAIGCVGTGLHTGRPVAMDLLPAGPDSGIVFTRADLAGSAPGMRDGPALPAVHDRVVDSRLCTTIGAGEARIGTIEHLMAAFAGLGIDNARIVLDGPEVPILDGSAEPFLFLIGCAGAAVQPAPRRLIEVVRPVRVEHGRSHAALLPADDAQTGLDLTLSIDFDAPAIGRQSLRLRLDGEAFRDQLAAARTFTQAAEIEALRSTGLARGGSLDNAVVVDGARVLNPGGLRMPDEFVRHKMLDAVGDLYLAGGALLGRFVAHRAGHALNNRLLHALFSDPAAWRIAPPRPAALPAAALPAAA